MRRALTSPAGSALRVDLAPSDDLVRQVATPWPRLFLLTGAILSVVLGALLLQFLRLRDFSAALGRTNLDLDAQLAQLSNRDRELRELNEALEHRVQARTGELTLALREVETFSHSVSHDLRSPIGAILNFTAVLQEDYGPHLDAEGARLLERVRAAAGRANKLLDALVEFAASGSAPEEAMAVDMTELAQRAFAEATGREGNGEVRFALAPLPPAWADPALVHRLFVNLFGNALKFTRGREPRLVEAGGSPDTTGNHYWVRDNGCGFEPARAAELFEPFRRLHGSDVEGTGLGLAIVARSVNRMGGRVWAESDGASGATFHFTLPDRERRGDAPPRNPARG
jgi:signal transduction histidine kinase